jgi:hypothetical protein
MRPTLVPTVSGEAIGFVVAFPAGDIASLNDEQRANMSSGCTAALVTRLQDVQPALNETVVHHTTLQAGSIVYSATFFPGAVSFAVAAAAARSITVANPMIVTTVVGREFRGTYSSAQVWASSTTTTATTTTSTMTSITRTVPVTCTHNGTVAVLSDINDYNACVIANANDQVAAVTALLAAVNTSNASAIVAALNNVSSVMTTLASLPASANATNGTRVNTTALRRSIKAVALGAASGLPNGTSRCRVSQVCFVVIVVVVCVCVGGGGGVGGQCQGVRESVCRG